MKIEIKIETQWEPSDDPRVIKHELDALRDAIDGFNESLVKLPEEKRPTVKGFDAGFNPLGSTAPKGDW